MKCSNLYRYTCFPPLHLTDRRSDVGQRDTDCPDETERVCPIALPAHAAWSAACR